MKRELIDRAPLAALAASWSTQEAALSAARDERGAGIYGDLRRQLEAAIADAERPPAEGMSAEEEAAREGVSVWAIWKRRQRARARAA